MSCLLKILCCKTLGGLKGSSAELHVSALNKCYILQPAKYKTKRRISKYSHIGNTRNLSPYLIHSQTYPLIQKQSLYNSPKAHGHSPTQKLTHFSNLHTQSHIHTNLTNLYNHTLIHSHTNVSVTWSSLQLTQSVHHKFVPSNLLIYTNTRQPNDVFFFKTRATLILLCSDTRTLHLVPLTFWTFSNSGPRVIIFLPNERNWRRAFPNFYQRREIILHPCLKKSYTIFKHLAMNKVQNGIYVNIVLPYTAYIPWLPLLKVHIWFISLFVFQPSLFLQSLHSFSSAFTSQYFITYILIILNNSVLFTLKQTQRQQYKLCVNTPVRCLSPHSAQCVQEGVD
jgi:hypothetical protein